MNQMYEFTTDYEWMLDQVENILWIMKKTTPSLQRSQFNNREIEAVFNEIKDSILTKRKDDNF
ncbi:MAG: hypothetical protein Q8S31_09590 [Alphaproteobacteria bacterium]|jgi:hypothetical protein|nr:hypothetical protein [Alphaproteobacteria bacterium]